jgi:hypothetical protein
VKRWEPENKRLAWGCAITLACGLLAAWWAYNWLKVIADVSTVAT